MGQIDQCCCCKDSKNDKSLDNEYQIYFYSPHPGLEVVVIAGKAWLCDRSTCMNPPTMIRIANQAVGAFKLDPSQVVWIEHTPSGSDPSFCADFHLIHFDWKAGQATSSYRSSISEDWYLSWLKAEPLPSQLKLTV